MKSFPFILFRLAICTTQKDGFPLPLRVITREARSRRSTKPLGQTHRSALANLFQKNTPFNYFCIFVGCYSLFFGRAKY